MESNFKKLHYQMRQNLLLHTALYTKTINTVKESKLPFIIINEANQFGNSFGEKFCNAIEYCFNSGYKNIIAIGSDCAALTVNDILNAHNSLLNNRNAIGADDHGGFYLLGLQQRNYQRTAFLNFNWCNTALFRNITAYLNNQSTNLFLLDKKTDVNSVSDVKLIIYRSSGFFKLLYVLFYPVIHFYTSLISFLPTFFKNTFLLRGPPCQRICI